MDLKNILLYLRLRPKIYIIMFIIDNIFSLDIVGIKSKSNDIHHTNIKETIKIQKIKIKVKI